MKNILIRVDGNSTIGLGHIYRGIAIAKMIDGEFDVIFVTREDSFYELIKSEGYRVIFMPEDVVINGEGEWLSDEFGTECTLILDGYKFTSEYQKVLKEKGFKLVYIDDLVEGRYFADLIINHALNVTPDDYRALRDTRYALGSDFTILRPQFLMKAQDKSTKKSEALENIFICFGGADRYNLANKFCSALINVRTIKKINLVLGSANSNEIDIEDARIVVHKNLSETDMLKVMTNCDVAFVSASSVLLEVLSARLTVFCGYYSHDQKTYYNNVLETGMFYPLGDLLKIDASEIIKGIKSITDEEIESMKAIQMCKIDGLSGARILNEIKKLNNA